MHPPSPSEDFTSYLQLIICMAKSLELNIDQPLPPKHDQVFEDINQERSPPLSLAFILVMLDLIKESWAQLPSLLQISRRLENHYKTHGADTFLSLIHI